MKNKILLSALILASSTTYAEVKQSLGVDSSVDYRALESQGPWDDRNYQLTKEDLAYLPANDHYLHNVPLFFKVKLRKENPHYGEFYPRSALQLFQIQYGGLLVDGIWNKEELGIGYHPVDTYGKSSDEALKATAEVEVALANGVNGNEVSIECNPVNKNNCVAGSNQSGGQSMYYSTDAGASWTLSQTNPSSCCDPTIDWSSDGSIVYQADLASNTAVRWSRSLDQGVTWEAMQTHTPGGTDKEFIHVDRSPSSPHKDNVYLTWHDGNVMQFTRSLDMGVTMEPTTVFNAEPTGIGSDITTDPAGNVYYVYPALGGQGIRVLKSTDGGASFSTGTQIAPLNGRFDMPIPSMESREAFIYVSTDVDKNTGDIYAAWTDETDDSAGGGNGSASANHAWIQVYKSSDQGVTWQQCTQPHDTSDTLAGTPVDRYHPWLKVGENGAVHIGYYDTRHSTNRTGVDFFYTNSVDGCATWAPEERFTTETSTNISNGQEWGDYNGLSVVMDRIAMTFTDNRPGAGQTAMVASGPNPVASESFSLSMAPNELAVCESNSYMATVTVDVTPGYAEDVTLSFTNIPSFVQNENLNPTLVMAPGTSDLTFDIVAGGTPGIDNLSVQGTGLEIASDTSDFLYFGGFELNNAGAPSIIKTFDLSLNYADAIPAATTLSSPADTATGVSGNGVVYNWDAVAGATGYTIEIATDAAFVNIVETANVVTNTYTAAVGLASSSDAYWRVTAVNACGNGVASATFMFTTSTEICFNTVTSIPDNNSTGVDITYNVADTGTISNLLVQVASDHTWPGDLVFTLTHGATSVVLMDRPGVQGSGVGCSQDGIDALFDDTSILPVEDECAASPPGIGGTLAPEEALSAFNGAELSGDWILNVNDNAGADTGDITNFCLIPAL